MGWETQDPQRLSYQEVLNALTQMSDANWKRAEAIARPMSHRLPGMTWEDLLQEVCTQLLSGRRRFPRGPAALVVLKTAMRSVASNVRKSGRASPIDIQYRVDTAEDPDDPRLRADAEDRRTPEMELLAREQLDGLSQWFAEDPEAELVVMAWADGLRGAEARVATGLSAKGFDAARRRAARKLLEIKSIGGGS